MKIIIFKTALALSAVLFFTACNNNNPNSKSADGTSDTASSMTTVSPTTDTKMSDTSSSASPTTNNGGMAAKSNDFVTKAAGGGMMEVELGKLAQTNASSQDVKDFGKMMVEDHTKAGSELQSIATEDNINFPTALPPDHAMHLKDFQAKTGADFDKAYVAMMVKDHGTTIADFKTAAAGNDDPKVKAFAAKTLPTLEGHMSKIKAIQAKMK